MTTATFRFDAEKHEYWLGDERLPSVSEILKSAGIAPSSDFTNGKIEYARELGTYVHQACALYDRGELDYDSLDPAIEPYLAAWVQFTVDFQTTWEMIESPRYHATLRYAGTPDRIGRVVSTLNQICVVEIKTGEPKKWHEIQTEAYKRLGSLGSHGHHLMEWVEGRMLVYLKSDGTYDERVCASNDWEVWEAAVTIAKWKRTRRSAP